MCKDDRKQSSDQTFGLSVGTHTFLSSFSLVISNSDGSLIRSTDANRCFIFSQTLYNITSVQKAQILSHHACLRLRMTIKFDLLKLFSV